MYENFQDETSNIYLFPLITLFHDPKQQSMILYINVKI